MGFEVVCNLDHFRGYILYLLIIFLFNKIPRSRGFYSNYKGELYLVLLFVIILNFIRISEMEVF